MDSRLIEKKAKCEAIIKRTDRFIPLFESDLFKEWMQTISSKVDAYADLLAKAPRVGDILMDDQIATLSDRKTVTKIPHRVTLDEQNEISSEYIHKIQELKYILDIPNLMKQDSERMKVEVERINEAIKKAAIS